MSRIEVRATAIALIRETWLLDVPDDFPAQTIETIDLDELLADSRVKFVSVTDETVGEEHDREIEAVNVVAVA